jgi:hypothetical protein
MPAPDDQQPVQALGTDRADPALRIGIRIGRPHRCQQHLGAFCAEHVVEAAAELRIPVAEQEAHPSPALLQCQQQVAACWVTQAPSGLTVTPARWTRRVSSSMKNSTYSRRSQMVSTVKQVARHDPSGLLAQELRQVVVVRRGAGPSPWRRSVDRIAVAETRTPSRRSSPLRRW